MRSLNASRNRRGLTLIELVFVVAILAILAGALVPRLGALRNLAADASSADQTRAALDQSVLYNIEQGKYPSGEDSLLDSTGVLYSKLDPSLSAVLTPHALTVNEAKSINTQLTFDSTGGSATYLFDANPAATVANDAFATLNSVLTAGASKVAQVTVPVAADKTGNKANYQIYAGVYGVDRLDGTTGAPLDGSFLIAFGFGSNSELIGKTALGAPTLFTKDPSAYSRPAFLLRVFGATPAGPFVTGSISGAQYPTVAAGTAGATAGALSADGKLVTQNLTKYQTDKAR